MHQVIFLLQILLFLTFALRIGEVLIKYLLRLHSDLLKYSPIEVLKFQPLFRPFSLAYGLRGSRYTSSEKRSMILLVFFMEVVCIMLLFPLQVLGIPESLDKWIVWHTYGALRGKFDEIEFADLTGVEEGGEHEG